MLHADSTFELCFVATPREGTSEYEIHGEARVLCWIVERSLEAAVHRAERYIRESGWCVLAQDAARKVSKQVYVDSDDRELLGYFDQAQIDEEVYVFHTSPRYSVYVVVLELSKAGSKVVGRYYVAGEALAGADVDLCDSDRWNETMAGSAVERALSYVRDEGWSVNQLSYHGPVDWNAVDGVHCEACELAEERGEYLLLDPPGSPQA